MANPISRCRWHLKKAARKGLAITARAFGWLTFKEGAGVGPRVRALTYHRFGECAHDPFCVSRQDFDAQMHYLAENGLAVSLDDVEAFVAGRKDLPDGSVLVTVDDGFRSVYTEMLPVLKRYAIPAVAYVAPSLIQDGGASRGDGGRLGNGADEHLTWGQLELLAADGVAVGSHGWTHCSLAGITPDEARHEAVRSREVLQRRLGCRVASFAYPYGTRTDFNDTTAGILAENGYTTAFTSQHGAITSTANPVELPRIKVEGGERPWMFRLLCAGALDGWRLVDRALWRFQRVGR